MLSIGKTFRTAQIGDVKICCHTSESGITVMEISFFNPAVNHLYGLTHELKTDLQLCDDLVAEHTMEFAKQLKDRGRFIMGRFAADRGVTSKMVMPGSCYAVGFSNKHVDPIYVYARSQRKALQDYNDSLWYKSRATQTFLRDAARLLTNAVALHISRKEPDAGTDYEI